MLFNVYDYSGVIIGIVEANDAVEAWSEAGEEFSSILDVRLVGGPEYHSSNVPTRVYEFYTEFPNINQLTGGNVVRCLKEDPSYKQWFEFLEIYYKIGLEIATPEEIEWGFHLVKSEIPLLEERLKQYAREDYPEEVDAFSEYLIPGLSNAVTQAHIRSDKVIAMDYFVFEQHAAAGIDPRLPLYTFGLHKETCGLDVVIEVLMKMREKRPPKDIWERGFA